MTVCGTLQFEVVKVSEAPEEMVRSESPLLATETVTVDDGCADRATPNVAELPCWTAT